MKIVIDEDLSRSLGAALQELGHEVFDIRDHGLRGKSDGAIFQFAQEKQAVLFSADLGFANILSFPLGTHNGIVILRFQNEMPTSVINQIVTRLIIKIPEADFMGNLIILSPDRLRIRRWRVADDSR